MYLFTGLKTPVLVNKGSPLKFELGISYNLLNIASTDHRRIAEANDMSTYVKTFTRKTILTRLLPFHYLVLACTKFHRKSLKHLSAKEIN